MKGQIKGKAEELKGKVTGNRTDELKGKARQTADKLRREGRDIKEDLRDAGTATAKGPAATPRKSLTSDVSQIQVGGSGVLTM